MDVTAKGFWKSYTNFGVISHAYMSYDWSFASAIFFSDFDVSACIV